MIFNFFNVQVNDLTNTFIVVLRKYINRRLKLLKNTFNELANNRQNAVSSSQEQSRLLINKVFAIFVSKIFVEYRLKNNSFNSFPL